MTVPFEFTKVDDTAKVMMLNRVNSLTAYRATNAYEALRRACELVEERTDVSRNASVLFFTDGIPNRSPREGEVKAMDSLKKEKGYTFPISTFGFGQYHRVHSEMLYEISKLYDGMFGYIPDA